MKILIGLALLSMAFASPAVQPITLPEAPQPVIENAGFEPVDMKPALIPQEITRLLNDLGEIRADSVQAVELPEAPQPALEGVELPQPELPTIETIDAFAIFEVVDIHPAMIPIEVTNMLNDLGEIRATPVQVVDAIEAEVPVDPVQVVENAEESAPVDKVIVVDFVEEPKETVVNAESADVVVSLVQIVDSPVEAEDAPASVENVVVDDEAPVDNASADKPDYTKNLEQLIANLLRDRFFGNRQDDFRLVNPGKYYDNPMLR